MNVYDQAHGLASAIKESEEFKQYNALKKQIDANEELSKMLKDFQAKQLEFQTKQMMGEQPNAEDMAGIQQLYTIMAADPLTSQYLLSGAHPRHAGEGRLRHHRRSHRCRRPSWLKAKKFMGIS